MLGGATRQASVRNGLEALAADPPDCVLIHDAARPFVSKDLISRVISALADQPAAIPGVAIADTLKRVEDQRVGATIARSGLMAVQTPQGFRYDLIRAAHRRAAEEQIADMTDDSSIAEWAGLTVAVVAGDPENRKLTTAADLSAAEWHAAAAAALATGDIRVGQGFDVHGFEPGDFVTLCGVKIPHGQRLSGHSDADAALHALTDAILGAIGEGDIGVHFPPSDPQWRGAEFRALPAPCAGAPGGAPRPAGQCRHHHHRRGAEDRAARPRHAKPTFGNSRDQGRPDRN